MSRHRGLLALPVIASALAVTLTAGAAWASWSAGSIPGGRGTASAASVQPGATPTATVSASNDITVSWAASTLSSNVAVAGYLISRDDATTSIAQTVTTGCAGIITATTCIENDLPDGQWVYAVTPVLGTFWAGATSAPSVPVTTEATPPSNAIGTTVLTGNAAQNGTTIFYRGSAAGSFTLTNTLADSGSGPASSTTTALSGDATGWAHTPSTVSSPPGGPYVSNPFSWSTATTSTPGEVVTGLDQAGNSVSTTLSFVDDSTAPTPGTISYLDGYQPDPSVAVTFASGTDSGSGIATRQLQRADAVLTDGVCGTLSGFADVGPDNPTSPYTDVQVANGSCYAYRYLVTDQVGNQDTATSPSVAKLDPSAGGPALASAGSYSVLAGTGVVNTLATVISGDLGVSPSSSVTGFPPGTVAGTVHAGDPAAAQAQSDLVLAYTNAAGRTATSQFAGDQVGKTFGPGVHHTAAAFALTGTMTLNGGGNPNSLFIFQVDAALNTAADSQVTLTNGAQASHVFWQVNGAAGSGASSSFAGTIMATGAITLGDGTQLIGRALSYATVTLANNTIRFTNALAPVLAIDGGAAAETQDTTPAITGTTNAATGTLVTVTVAGQTITTVVQAGTWTVTAAALIAGAHNVTATVRDPAGNAGTATQTLTIEINPNPVLLRNAAPYSVLAGTGVVGTGTTAVSGDLGVSPSSAVTGFPPGTVGGTIHAGDSAAAQAQSDLVLAYNDAAGRTPSREFAGDQVGQTYHVGIHHTATAFALTGTLTLDGQGDPNAIFIIQVDAALNTAAGSHIALVNSAQASHVFWQVAGAAGTGASSFFTGTIMATGDITLGDSTQLTGQALSYGTVTLANNTISAG